MMLLISQQLTTYLAAVLCLYACSTSVVSAMPPDQDSWSTNASLTANGTESPASILHFNVSDSDIIPGFTENFLLRCESSEQLPWLRISYKQGEGIPLHVLAEWRKDKGVLCHVDPSSGMSDEVKCKGSYSESDMMMMGGMDKQLPYLEIKWQVAEVERIGEYVCDAVEFDNQLNFELPKPQEIQVGYKQVSVNDVLGLVATLKAQVEENKKEIRTLRQSARFY